MAEMYIVWGKDNCQYCERAKRLLESKNIEYDYLTLGIDYEREDLLEMVPDAKTVPQIWYIEDDMILNDKDRWEYVGGYTELENSFKNEVEVLLNAGHTVEVTFTKADGTDRVMLCTRNPSIIEEFYNAPEKSEGGTERKKAEGVLAVFDLDKHSWRSFRLDSIKSYVIVEDIQ